MDTINTDIVSAGMTDSHINHHDYDYTKSDFSSQGTLAMADPSLAEID